MGKRDTRALLVGKRKGDTMSRQTNISEMKLREELEQLKEELEQWETHWTFLRDWIGEWNDSQIPSRRRTRAQVLKVMDELRPRGENNDE